MLTDAVVGVVEGDVITCDVVDGVDSSGRGVIVGCGLEIGGCESGCEV